MKRNWMRIAAIGLVSVMMVGSTACGGSKAEKSPLDPKNPTTITIWNYYNGDQLTAFDALISDFNSTVGIEKGIAVDSVSQGSIDNLASGLIDAADGKVGAQDFPTLAAIYAETAYILDEKELLVNMDQYFTKEELSVYVPEFIDEGRIVEGGELLLFPISKSTECFAINTTDWEAFQTATGITVDSIESVEDLTSVAEKYYEWTDSLTPDITEDGKALYGRDSVANYIYVGTRQLNQEMFSVTKDGLKVNLDRAAFKKLWDNYYIPYINGYFTAESSHRSEDMKTGKILALTCSTSGVNYLPTAVTDQSDVSHEIGLTIEKPLTFKGAEEAAVQQGAGYCIIKGTEAQQYAAAEFLKWFTEPDQNLQFSVSSGYSAVTINGNDAQQIQQNFVGTGNATKDQNILTALQISADVYMNEKTYITKPFSGSKDVRDLLGTSMSDIAAADRITVLAAMQQGKTRAEATAAYTTDAYFDAWFQTLTKSIEDAVK